MAKRERRAERSAPLGGGLVLAASFWLWGALLFCAPVYLNLASVWRTWLNVLGSVFFAVGFARAGVEFARAFENRAFCYWGLGMLFTVPAVVLHIITICNSLPVLWTFVARLVVLIFLSIGGVFLLYGFPYLFGTSEVKADDQEAQEASVGTTMPKGKEQG